MACFNPLQDISLPPAEMAISTKTVASEDGGGERNQKRGHEQQQRNEYQCDDEYGRNDHRHHNSSGGEHTHSGIAPIPTPMADPHASTPRTWCPSLRVIPARFEGVGERLMDCRQHAQVCHLPLPILLDYSTESWLATYFHAARGR